MRFPPHKKVEDIKNYPSFNLRKDGVQVEVLQWIGISILSELQEVWVQMRFIPPRYYHWKVFAQIASSFGMLTEVDWPTLFKTLYEVVRIKVASKDWRKIPAERLYEMDKKLYVVSLLVENEEDNGKAVDGKGDDGDSDGDNGGNDGDKGLDEDNKEEADC